MLYLSIIAAPQKLMFFYKFIFELMVRTIAPLADIKIFARDVNNFANKKPAVLKIVL